MTATATGCAAVILAGGGSRRLGRLKAFVEIAGREILERELEATSEIDDTILATNDPHPYAAAVRRYGWAPAGDDPPGDDPAGSSPLVFRLGTRCLRIVMDRVPDLGPVGGLAAGLGAAEQSLCWVLSCDLPFVTPELGRVLLRELDEAGREAKPRAVIPYLEGRAQPLCAAWDADAAAIAQRCLEAGRRSVLDLLREVDVRALSRERLGLVGDPTRLLLNVNTPRDLETAQRLATPD